MSGFSDLLAGPAGAAVAILGMTLATYLCRASGVVLMSRVAITPRVDRALRALPGSIVVAAIVPLALDGGVAAILALAVSVVVMGFARLEVFALLAGLAAASLVRVFAG